MTRQEIADLLKGIGKPGEKRDEKDAAIMKLNLQNQQKHDVQLTLESYKEY